MQNVLSLISAERSRSKGARSRLLFRPFEICLEPVQDFDGVRGIRADPAVVNMFDGERIEVVPPFASLALGNDEVGLLEHLKVLHHGTAVESGEMLAKRTRRGWLIPQDIEHRASNRGC